MCFISFNGCNKQCFFCSPVDFCVFVGRGLGKRASASLNGHHVPVCLNWRGLLSSGESFWGWCLSRASKDRHVLVPHLKPPMRRWWVTDSQQRVRCDICQQMRKWFAAFNSKPLFACQNRGVFFHKPAQLSTPSDFWGQWIYLFRTSFRVSLFIYLFLEVLIDLFNFNLYLKCSSFKLLIHLFYDDVYVLYLKK